MHARSPCSRAAAGRAAPCSRTAAIKWLSPSQPGSDLAGRNLTPAYSAPSAGLRTTRNWMEATSRFPTGQASDLRVNLRSIPSCLRLRPKAPARIKPGEMSRVPGPHDLRHAQGNRIGYPAGRNSVARPRPRRGDGGEMMQRGRCKLVRCMLALTALLALQLPTFAAEQVDLLLVLSSDVSRSVDHPKFLLQRE